MQKSKGCVARIAWTLCIGIGLLVLLARTAGPPVLRRVLMQNLAFSGLRVQSLEIRRLGFHEIEIGHLRVRGSGALEALAMGRLQMQYRPGRLLRGEIDRITVADVVIDLLAGSNGVQTAGAKDAPAPRLPAGTIPRVQNILVEGVRIVCHRGQESWTIPLSASMDLEAPPAQYRFQIRGGEAPFSLHATGSVDAVSGQGQAGLSAQDIPMDTLVRLAGRPYPLAFPIRAAAEATVDWVAWQPVAGRYTAAWELPNAAGPVEWRGHWQQTADQQWDWFGEMPPTRLIRKTDLGDWSPRLAGIELRGGIGATASVRLDGPAMQTRGTVTLDNLHVGLPHRSTTLSNLAGTLVFSSVPELITDGVQTVRFARIESGALAITTGTVAFARQDSGAIHLESASGHFCGGRLEAGGLDIRTHDQAMDSTIRCEGIQLAALLNLTGWVVAEGLAELSGQLPFRIHGGTLEVDNGFLETAAGQSCRIRVLQEELLTRNLPPGHSSYLYASIAEEALEDFRCDWARAEIRLAAGRATVAVSIRGAPNRRLPFGYNVKKQVFFRTPPEKSNADFSQGLTLTLRFNDVSVEELLYTAPVLDMLMHGN